MMLLIALLSSISVAKYSLGAEMPTETAGEVGHVPTTARIADAVNSVKEVGQQVGETLLNTIASIGKELSQTSSASPDSSQISKNNPHAWTGDKDLVSKTAKYIAYFF